MTTGGQHIAFENGNPVLTTDFSYPKESHDDDLDHEIEAGTFELLQNGLMLCFGAGHRDGLRTRLLALMRLCGMFSTDAEAARFGGLNRSGLSRAVRRLRREMAASLSPEKTAPIARKQRRFQN